MMGYTLVLLLGVVQCALSLQAWKMYTMLQEDSPPDYAEGQWAHRDKQLNFEYRKEILKGW